MHQEAPAPTVLQSQLGPNLTNGGGGGGGARVPGAIPWNDKNKDAAKGADFKEASTECRNISGRHLRRRLAVRRICAFRRQHALLR